MVKLNPFRFLKRATKDLKQEAELTKTPEWVKLYEDRRPGAGYAAIKNPEVTLRKERLLKRVILIAMLIPLPLSGISCVAAITANAIANSAVVATAPPTTVPPEVFDSQLASKARQAAEDWASRRSNENQNWKILQHEPPYHPQEELFEEIHTFTIRGEWVPTGETLGDFAAGFGVNSNGAVVSISLIPVNGVSQPACWQAQADLSEVENRQVAAFFSAWFDGDQQALIQLAGGQPATESPVWPQYWQTGQASLVEGPISICVTRNRTMADGTTATVLTLSALILPKETIAPEASSNNPNPQPPKPSGVPDEILIDVRLTTSQSGVVLVYGATPHGLGGIPRIGDIK